MGFCWCLVGGLSDWGSVWDFQWLWVCFRGFWAFVSRQFFAECFWLVGFNSVRATEDKYERCIIAPGLCHKAGLHV